MNSKITPLNIAPNPSIQKYRDTVNFERKISENCIYWFNALQKPIKNLSAFGAELNIDPSGLVFSVGDKTLFTISNEGKINLTELNDLEQLIKNIQFTISTIERYNQALKVLSSVIYTANNKRLILPDEDGTLLTKDQNENIKINGIIKNNHTLSIPTITQDDTIVTTKTNQTIYGIKTFTEYTPFSKGLYNTQTTANIKLPEKSGRIPSNDINKYLQDTEGFITEDTSDPPNTYSLKIPTLTKNETIATVSNIPTDYAKVVSSKITNADGFKVGNYTLSTPTLTTNRTIATTADIPSIPTDYVSTGSSTQSIAGTKTFTSKLVIQQSSRQLYHKNSSSGTEYYAQFPTKSGTVAMTADIPSIPTIPAPSNAIPEKVTDLASTHGISTEYARADHKHAVDTTKVCTLNDTQTLKGKTLYGAVLLNMPTYKTYHTYPGPLWIDNKTIFRIVITGTTRSSAGVQAYSVGTTIDKLINAYGCLQESDGTQVFLGYTNISSGAQFGIYTSSNRQNINIRVGSSSMYSRPFWLTLEFTVNA